MLRTTSAGLVAFLACLGMAQAQSSAPIRIGVLNDQSGIYSDFAGPGSVIAARLAVEDAGGNIIGRQVEIISADHQNKPEIGSSIARRWYDLEGVSAIVDVPNSAVAAAVQQIARDKQKVVLFSSASGPDVIGRGCTATSFQWTYNTASAARSIAPSVIKDGGRSWYFISVDYAYGHATVRDATAIINQNGGKVVGNTRHPPGTTDFASYLLQAQSSGADVIAFVSGGSDLVTALKQASEFGLTSSNQRIVSLQTLLTDINGLGLAAAKGLTIVEPFYWNADDATRSWSSRFSALNKNRMPTTQQAGVYSAVAHYLEGIAKAGTTDGPAVATAMRDMPIDDMMTHKAHIRSDGWVMREMYLFRVKAPAESRGPWDFYDKIATIDPLSAAPPIQKECEHRIP